MNRIRIAISVCVLAAIALYLLVRLLSMPLWFAIALAAVGTVSLLLASFTDRREIKRALAHMEGRPSLTPDEFGRHYFPPDQAAIAAEVRTIFARHIPVDVSQAHPDDAVVEDLRMDALDSMSTVEFVIELEERFKIAIPDSTAEAMRTLRDITDFISHAIRCDREAASARQEFA
jgi:acyl carrier protein